MSLSFSSTNDNYDYALIITHRLYYEYERFFNFNKCGGHDRYVET